MKRVSTHRFHELCGLSILGQPGETVYLTAAECRKVARALNACARSINAERFAYSRGLVFQLRGLPARAPWRAYYAR